LKPVCSDASEATLGASDADGAAVATVASIEKSETASARPVMTAALPAIARFMAASISTDPTLITAFDFTVASGTSM
jgi:hypothetical protein